MPAIGRHGRAEKPAQGLLQSEPENLPPVTPVAKEPTQMSRTRFAAAAPRLTSKGANSDHERRKANGSNCWYRTKSLTCPQSGLLDQFFENAEKHRIVGFLDVALVPQA